MRTHQEIDRRSMKLAELVVQKIEAGDISSAIARAQSNIRRWRNVSPSRLHREWETILSEGWPSIRAALLDESEHGIELRQNNPFCGILSPRERWTFFREYHHHDA